ncbi:MAG: Unknown protein [uncultured Thiotrichaceae bacterium]|uniref:Uncharacterized protein n=1 Tax=uncultured Thiotrichaceae bacterium TaxID=298394 RepID=A0A6S6UAC1_9GAMM|nr:MAG: Unknown protein [uncultured Thiotrichaceae bacterium]
MLETFFQFMIILVIVSVPCYAFYKVGINAGIQRGVKRQILRELMLCGVIEKTEPGQRH